ncbi:MAG: hypothetical protein LBT95_01110 [Treponema sp.]|jgi:hypothetical protein|nr:hypothetical protein [Treponema sp.]
MNKRINFEDNIFILTRWIRIIRDLLILDADPELFLEKILRDIEFIDTTLNALLESLIQNNRLIERDIQYENLADAEWQFSLILSGLLKGSGTISAARFPMIRERVEGIEQHSLERNKTIDGTRGQTDKDSMESVVSSDELSELFKN